MKYAASRQLKQIALIGVLAAAAPALADEGMWTVDNFPAGKIADKYGTIVDTPFLDKLRLATARIEGGCTGSFASPEGLILTNHHCIQRCLTQLSSEEDDVRANGFLARERDAEQRCESEQISVLIGYEDITDKVVDATKDLADEDANQVRKSTLTELENACRNSSENDTTECEAVTLYNGGQYFMYQYKRFNDVRLVFAPEQAIAAFGGDPDNFNFPRWCLDMALLRVYEDGKPAMSPDYLRWKRNGANAGDTVFVSGHPGSTQRLQSVTELQMLRDTQLPSWIERYAELRGRIIQFAKRDDESRRVARGELQGLENGLKVQRNRLRALLKQESFDAKIAEEQALRKAIAESPELKKKYQQSWGDIDRAIAEYRNIYTRYLFVEQGAGFNSELFSYARSLVRAAAEREKPETQRLRAYTDSGLKQIRQRMLASRPINNDLEILTLSFSLDKLREILGPDDYFVKLVLKKHSPDALAEKLVTQSKLADPAVREALWEGGQAAITASDDPLIQLARAIDPEARSLRKTYDDKVEAPLRTAGEKIAAARFAVLGTSTYPDATFSFRITYGQIKGWQEDGELVEPFTTLGQLYPRVTGEHPFVLPESWQETSLDKKLKFNSIANTDIIGGNSGSAVTNAAGELVGLAFDGNIHSIAGSYWFDESVNRTVFVHPAIMLGALEDIYQAKDLVAEIAPY